MSKIRKEKIKSEEVNQKDRAFEVANTLEWVITAFILAFVFRAFVMEAFRIPTGSMADTLKGAYFRLVCPQCGYKYDHGFDSRMLRLPQDVVPSVAIRVPPTRCPSCGHYPVSGRAVSVSNGDRILVLKCIYQFFEPKRWDVVVFKNPLEPRINYIKRLVGRPGETVEVIDGDVYIDGQIGRKPPKVQNELWMPVYDNDYQPVQPTEGRFNGHTWEQPFKNTAGSQWKVDKNNPTVFCLDSAAGQVNTLFYDTSVGNDFRAIYAYNDVSEYGYSPYCSDLKVRFWVASAEPGGRIGMSLSKYGNLYKAWFDFSGEMVIERTSQGGSKVLARSIVAPQEANKSVLVEFFNVDHELIFRFGEEILRYDLGRSADDAGPRRTDIQPEAGIFGSGKLRLSHIAIFRDIHYTSKQFAGSRETGRATEGNPFKLEENEFFVLGDNSPNSEDCRWWDERGKGNNGLSYRQGIVPREYLVGKALFVYWPSGFKPFINSRFALVPNIGQLRFIYGGSGRGRGEF